MPPLRMGVDSAPIEPAPARLEATVTMEGVENSRSLQVTINDKPEHRERKTHALTH